MYTQKAILLWRYISRDSQRLARSQISHAERDSITKTRQAFLLYDPSDRHTYTHKHFASSASSFSRQPT